MHRINKVKDAKRRARNRQQRLQQAGAIKTGVRIIPDKRHKPPKHNKPLQEDV